MAIPLLSILGRESGSSSAHWFHSISMITYNSSVKKGRRSLSQSHARGSQILRCSEGASADESGRFARHPLETDLRSPRRGGRLSQDRKSTRLNSSHVKLSYAV